MSLMLRFLTLCSVFCLLSAELLAQPPGRGRGGFGRGMGGQIGLLMNEEVRKEIELLEDQESDLRAMGEEIRDEIREEMGDMFRGMRDLSPEEREARMEDIRARMDEVRKEAEGRMAKILLPHQVERLKQIEVQQQIQREGGAALAEGSLAEKLNLSDEQKAQMTAKAAEARKELEEKIRQARQEAQEKILSILTPEQRAQYDAMVGTPFELQRGDDRGRRDRGPRGFRGDRRRGPRSESEPAI